MTDKKKQTEAGATELTEEEVGKVQGGWSWGETNSGVKLDKKADSFKAGADLQKK